MKCDQAFELMTDPVGTTSPALQRHLERCPRCRQMQQTLSPALDWMRSPSEAEASDRSFGSEAPFLTAQAVMVAEQVARSLPRRREWLGESVRRAMLITAVALFGMAFGALLMELRSRETPAMPAGTLTACLWEQPSLRDRLPDISARGVVVSCVACHVPSTVQ
jgi:hypothetical protein